MKYSVEAYLELLDQNIQLNSDTISPFTEQYVNEILITANEAKDEELNSYIVERFTDLVGIAKSEAAVYLCFSALNLKKTESVLRKLLEITYEYKGELGPDNVFDVFQQAMNISFRFPDTDSLVIFELKSKLYKWIIERYSAVLHELLMPMPKQERNKDMALVVVQQMLDYQHGPTKQALCRSKALIDVGYKVLLINTAELMSDISSIRLLGKAYANYKDDYLEKDTLEWDGVAIPFFQCEQNMPNIQSIKQLLQAVRDLKPSFAISIAAGTVFEGLLSQLIPVLCVPMSQSEVVVSGATCQIHTGSKEKEYGKKLQILGLNDTDIIESEFSFSLMEQKEVHTRDELNVSEDTFLIVVAGGRIDDELDDAFWNMIRQVLILGSNIKIMVMGDYHHFDKLEDISSNLVPVGFVNDSQSYFELCDLFINPHRKGGGTGCIEAMSKGVPIVTDSFGDVAANAGKEFWHQGYSEFVAAVEKYYKDSAYYDKQSALAKKRAEYLLNADEVFIKAISDFMGRVL